MRLLRPYLIAFLLLHRNIFANMMVLLLTTPKKSHDPYRKIFFHVHLSEPILIYFVRLGSLLRHSDQGVAVELHICILYKQKTKENEFQSS